MTGGTTRRLSIRSHRCRIQRNDLLGNNVFSFYFRNEVLGVPVISFWIHLDIWAYLGISLAENQCFSWVLNFDLDQIPAPIKLIIWVWNRGILVYPKISQHWWRHYLGAVQCWSMLYIQDFPVVPWQITEQPRENEVDPVQASRLRDATRRHGQGNPG